MVTGSRDGCARERPRSDVDEELDCAMAYPSRDCENDEELNKLTMLLQSGERLGVKSIRGAKK